MRKETECLHAHKHKPKMTQTHKKLNKKCIITLRAFFQITVFKNSKIQSWEMGCADWNENNHSLHGDDWKFVSQTLKQPHS